MATATVEKKKVSVASWGFEANHPRNADILIQGIAGCRLRSAAKAVKDIFTKNPETQEQELASAPAHLISGLPADIPGQQLHVDPANGTWKVYDPLTKEERKCERIKKAVENQTGISVAAKLRGVPTKNGRLNKDQMKTLLREMCHLVEADYVKVVNGMKPDFDDIDDMPGDYLTNPMKMSKWRMPRYEKDVEMWEDTLNRVG